MSKTRRQREAEREERRRLDAKAARKNRRYRLRAVRARQRRRLWKRAVLEAGDLGIRSARADVPDDYKLSALGRITLEELRRREPDLDRETWIAVLPPGVQRKIRARDEIRAATIHPPRDSTPWREILNGRKR